MKRFVFGILFSLVCFVSNISAESFTANDRKMLIELNIQVKEVHKHIDDVIKRIDDVNKRIDDVIASMHTLTLLFGGMFATMIGFAIWDRRTAIFKAKEETLKELNKSGEMVKVIPALREYAAHHKDFEKILRQYGLM